MKLLLDHNLSPRLTGRLADIFTGISHITFHALDKASDVEVWQFASMNGFNLVTKDSDFYDLSLLRGFPPKVIWLRIGNCTTTAIEELIREHQQDIQLFETDSEAGTLALHYSGV